MSERMTSICLPGLLGAGIADWGRKSPDEMIAMVRAHAQHARDEADAILAAADSDFRVETYVGVHVRRRREIIQAGLTPSPAKKRERA